MTLTVGTILGSFEITGELGVGGMGEVYRATDTKLGREVAIKTLSAGLADDADRLARFEREAKLLAALNHAHIASVYSLDEHEGTLYIAMELCEGETLEDKLEAGVLPVRDALELGRQIALALEAAHEKGVVHRDLKPANIMVTADGVVKVLDFGLAKAFADNPNEASPLHSPALSAAMTAQGLVLGTAGYMSPEQASGQPADQRADVWAFGVLTGLPLFSGESVPHILADVLKSEPDWSRLPKRLHPRIRELLARCLTKKPKNRYAGIADARVDIEAALDDPTEEVSFANQAPRQQGTPLTRFASRAAIGLAGALVAGLVAVSLWPSAPVSQVERFVHLVPRAEDGILGLDVAPDGRSFVYTTSAGIHLRPLDQLEPTTLLVGDEPETSRPSSRIGDVNFSPDSAWVGYYQEESIDISSAPSLRAFQSALDDRRGWLRRIPVEGGTAEAIHELDAASAYTSGSWASDGNVVYSDGDRIWRVRPGETPTPLYERQGDEERIWNPELLPRGDTILFNADFERVAVGDEFGAASRIVVQSLVTDARVNVGRGVSAKYLRSGHIVYVRGNTLYGVTFDTDTLTVGTDHQQLVQDVRSSLRFNVSVDGTLVYVKSTTEPSGFSFSVPDTALVWVDASGNETSIDIEPGSYAAASVSPDGRRVAVNRRTGGGGLDVWRFDIDRLQLDRVTQTPADLKGPPRWLDDRAIVYHALIGG